MDCMSIVSPDQVILFHGNRLFHLLRPDYKPLILPIPAITSETHPAAWRCGFTADSKYFVASFDPCVWDHLAASLHMFALHMDDWSFEELPTTGLEWLRVAEFDRFGMAFHPARPELALCCWPKQSLDAAEDTNSFSARFLTSDATDKTITDIHCYILDLDSMATKQLQPPDFGKLNPDHFRKCSLKEVLSLADELILRLDAEGMMPNAVIKYSLCGSYLFLYSEGMPALHWPIPDRAPVHIRSKIIRHGQTESWDMIASGTSDRRKDPNANNIAITRSSGGWHRRKRRLTILPMYLESAETTILLGDDEDPKIRVLFCQEERRPEMKYLKFTFEEFFGRFMVRLPKIDDGDRFF
jgi:hypothetical protein